MRRTLFSLALGLGCLTGVHAQTPRDGVAADVAEYDVYLKDLMDNKITTITFEKNDLRLSSDAKESLTALAKATKGNKNVDALVVAAWSDANYPAAKGQQLSDANRKLADARKDEIERFLKKAGANDVSAYSMAEQPSWISKTFNTEGALIKNKGRKLTDESKLEAAIGQRIRDAGGPGKGVVVIKFDTDVVAH